MNIVIKTQLELNPLKRIKEYDDEGYYTFGVFSY